MVETYEEEFNGYLINFLYPQGITKQYRFQNVPDKCFVPKENILDVLKTTKLTGGSRIIYSFNQEELNVVKNMLLISLSRFKYLQDILIKAPR